MSSVPVRIWVVFRLELVTDRGGVKFYWMVKWVDFPHFPPIGMEVQVPSVRDTVTLDRILLQTDGQYVAYQAGWVSVGLGDFLNWETAGWNKSPIDDENDEEVVKRKRDREKDAKK